MTRNNKHCYHCNNFTPKIINYKTKKKAGFFTALLIKIWLVALNMNDLLKRLILTMLQLIKIENETVAAKTLHFFCD